MLKYIVLLVLIIHFIYNYKCKSKNIINVKKQPIIFVLILLSAIIFCFICYYFDNSILGYLIVSFATMSIYTSYFYQGITNNGIHIFLGTTPLLKFARFEDIKKICIEKSKKDEFKLTIYVFGNEFHQIYNIKDKDRILKIINPLIH